MLRKEKDWSQTELSDKLHTSVSVISRYERDEMIPSIEAAKSWPTYLVQLLVIYSEKQKTPIC